MHAGRDIVIRTTAPSGLSRGFVNGNRDTGLGQPHGCGEAGQPGAYDVYMPDHQTMP
jgi:hypothetical protein